jgi:hypothetical protein
MVDNKAVSSFYFHPLFIPVLILIPILMMVPIYNLLNKEAPLKGYLLISFMIIVTALLFFRIVKYFIRLISGKPALVITENNFFDFQTGLTIEWKDIENFSLDGYRSKYISIKLNNREKYISLFKNPLARLYYRLHSKLFHGTFTFNVDFLKGKNENILEILNDYLKTVHNK